VGIRRTTLLSRIQSKERWVPVAIVDPRNTSRECPECHTIDKRNRPSRNAFRCIQCGLEAMADHIASRNIAHRGRFNEPSPKRVCNRGRNLLIDFNGAKLCHWLTTMTFDPEREESCCIAWDSGPEKDMDEPLLLRFPFYLNTKKKFFRSLKIYAETFLALSNRRFCHISCLRETENGNC
jgi:Putative transposase DNA-binding domain